MKTNIKNVIAVVLLPFLAIGCTHTLKTTKGPMTPAAAARLERPVRLGFTSVGSDRLLEAAVKKVKQDASIADAKEDFKPGGDYKPDFVCQLAEDSQFKASGQNFFITFPGFIVFSHALVGYKYKADITTHSTLLDAKSNVVSQVDIKTPYEFRHCSFARGAAAGCCGWLAPGYGAAAIIPGAIFASSYDKRATSEFLEKAAPSYSSYVASRILDQLSQAQANCPPNPSSKQEASEASANKVAGDQ